MDVKRYCIVDKKRGVFVYYNESGEPTWSSSRPRELSLAGGISLKTEIPLWPTKSSCENFIKKQMMNPVKHINNPFSGAFSRTETICPRDINYAPVPVEVHFPENRKKSKIKYLWGHVVTSKEVKDRFSPDCCIAFADLAGTSVSEYVLNVAARGKYEFNFPQDLLKDLCISAQKNGRTFSDEIIHRLVEQQANGKGASDGR